MSHSPELVRGPQAIFSRLLEDGRVVECVFDPADRRTRLAVWDGSGVVVEDQIVTPTDHLVPYSAANNLLTHGVVLLPSGIEEYRDDGALHAEIKAYIHRYVDLTPAFETLAAYYVMFSWLFDGFNELPYLRVRGDPGCGKTRFLLIVGRVAYKPIFASGASTVSPIFRILDSVRGTLVMDESDFRASDEKSEIVKILNNGNARGFPVLRSEVVNKREYDPRAYVVFGPKLVATRGYFEDRALESRFLTEDLGRRPMRRDIPISLPPEAESEALSLRNRLLLYRFRNSGARTVTAESSDPTLEARFNQVFGPLMSIVTDPAAREDLRTLVQGMNREAVTDRGLELEAQVLEAIRDVALTESPVPVTSVAALMAARHGSEYARPFTPKWIGHIVRRKLLLKTERRSGAFILSLTESATLAGLLARYGLAESVENADRPECPVEAPVMISADP
jgi:hypothetical protein